MSNDAISVLIFTVVIVGGLGFFWGLEWFDNQTFQKRQKEWLNSPFGVVATAVESTFNNLVEEVDEVTLLEVGSTEIHAVARVVFDNDRGGVSRLSLGVIVDSQIREVRQLSWDTATWEPVSFEEVLNEISHRIG